MAAAAVAQLIAGPIVELLISKVNSSVWKELHLLRGVEEDVEKLRSTLLKISDVLADAEKKSIAEASVRDWLNGLKNAAYNAEDLLDEFEIEALRRQIEGHKLKGQVCGFFSPHSNPISFRCKIGHKLKDVLKKLDEIDAERNKFSLIQGSGSTGLRQEEICSIVQSSVYGRDNDKEGIVNALLNENNDKDLSVHAIVGLGGVGKTTLAQLVYNDDNIKHKFHSTAWVCVSDDFDVRVILKKVIHCVNREARCDHLELESLSQLLRESLARKKFFLVLDDVWNENRGKWEKLQSLLRCGGKGSKIVVTTRSEVVASVMDNVKIHQLGRLQDGDCWKLFSERAFAHGKQEETPRLVEIGEEIVKRCCGLPLAAKALGSVMSTKQGEHEWLDVQKSEMLSFADNENEILPVLYLSYYHLPSHLKRCFVFCSLFPKDYCFDKNKLVNLWLCEGFIQSFDDGHSCFNNLLRRSFFDEDEDEGRGGNWYKMHDLMHDLACHAAGHDFLRMTNYKEISEPDYCHHLSVNLKNEIELKTIHELLRPKNLRTLLLSNEYANLDILSMKNNWGAMIQLSYIRVLDLSASSTSKVPSAICQLKHLRLLDLSDTEIRTLPSTIGKIYNLSTLILAHCGSLKRLPSTICRLVKLSTLDLYCCESLKKLPAGLSNMKSLVHLDIQYCDRLNEMPPGMGQLTNLQTMPRFVVGTKNELHITELKQLNKIRGRLAIYNLHRVKSPQETKEANLTEKVNMKQLKFSWHNGYLHAETIATAEEADTVFEQLVPPPRLEELKMYDYGGAGWPSWMMMASSSSFQNLATLELYGLKRCEVLPPLGRLPSLTRLEIYKMTAVRRIGEEFYDGLDAAEAVRCNFIPFPKLEYFKLSYMDNLEGWLVGAGREIGIEIERERMFPSLETLFIDGCPKLREIHPGLPLSIVKMQVWDSSPEMLSAKSLAGLSRLTKLEVDNIKAPSSSWGDLGLHHLVALQTLEVQRCDELTCLPKEMIQHHIPTLRQLTLDSNVNLTMIAGDEWQQQPPPLFTSLHTLTIISCSALTALPDGLQHLTALRQLDIRGCDSITALPDSLAALTSLQVLKIVWCPKLEMLPDGLQQLTALRQLEISGCPMLERRCKRENGEDWHKIAHIPNLDIDEPRDTTNRRSSSLFGSCFTAQI